MDSLKGLVSLITIVVVILFAIFCSIIFVVERASLPGDLAKIEQLRADVANVEAAESEDVIGQVTQWNQAIASKQQYNKTWWAGWSIPDEWDNVELIEIPER